MEIHHVFFFPLCDLFVCSNQRFFLHYHHWHSEVLATPQFPTSFQQGPVLTNSQFSICDPNDGLTASKQLTSSTATTMRKRSSHQAGFSWYLVVSCGILWYLVVSLQFSTYLCYPFLKCPWLNCCRSLNFQISGHTFGGPEVLCEREEEA